MKIRILGVRRAALAAAVAAVVALPIGMLALEGRASRLNAVPVRGPVALASPGPERPSIAPATARDDARTLAEHVRTLPTSDLTQLVRAGNALEQCAALHVLWTRGNRSEVETLVAESGSRELIAKLEALRARTK